MTRAQIAALRATARLYNVACPSRTGTCPLGSFKSCECCFITKRLACTSTTKRCQLAPNHLDACASCKFFKKKEKK